MKQRAVLVVEDNPDHALLMRLATERADPDLFVHVCVDGEEAVAFLSGAGPYTDRGRYPLPDLVILDQMMPRLDGFSVLGWLREQPHFRDLPVVVLTSSLNPRDEARALRLGASAFHTKRPHVEELGAQVRSIVKRWVT